MTWRVAYLVLQGAGGLAVFVGVAQVLPAESFAAVAIALGVTVLAQAVADFGFAQAAVTALPARLADGERRETAIGSVAAVFIVASVAATGLCVAAVLVMPEAARGAVTLIAPAAGAAVLVAGADGILRAEGNFVAPVRMVAWSRLGGLIAIPAAVLDDRAGVVALSYCLGTLTGSLPAARLLVTAAGSASAAGAWAFVNEAAPLGVAQLAVVGATRANLLLLASAGATPLAIAAFEGAWRVYQLGQYALGAAVTGIAPILADARGRADAASLRALRRIAYGLVVLSCVAGIGITLGRDQIASVLYPQLIADVISEALLPLGLITPVAIVALWLTTVLAADARRRSRIAGAYLLGCAANLVVLVPGPATALRATIACSCGVVVTCAVLSVAVRAHPRSGR